MLLRLPGGRGGRPRLGPGCGTPGMSADVSGCRTPRYIPWPRTWLGSVCGILVGNTFHSSMTRRSFPLPNCPSTHRCDPLIAESYLSYNTSGIYQTYIEFSGPCEILHSHSPARDQSPCVTRR